MKVLVFVHFHINGKVRKDTLSFINKAVFLYDFVYFVSTNLSDNEIKNLHPKIKVIVRENIGRDFFSYRAGILDFMNSYNFDKKNGYISLINDSFIICNEKKFLTSINKSFRKKNIVTGITISDEPKKHIQSFFLTIPFDFFNDQSFRNWWIEMKPTNSKEEIISKFEIGLSQKLLSLGARLSSIHSNKFTYFNKYLEKFKSKITLSSLSRNPCFFDTAKILKKIGIIKVEILKENPNNQDLSEFLDEVEKFLEFKPKNFDVNKPSAYNKGFWLFHAFKKPFKILFELFLYKGFLNFIIVKIIREKIRSPELIYSLLTIDEKYRGQPTLEKKNTNLVFYDTFMDLKGVHKEVFSKNLKNNFAADLGCGEYPKNLFNANKVIGLDLVGCEKNKIVKCKLGFETIPFEDNTFDYLTAYDLVGHIPKYSESAPFNNPFIFFMNECYRTLKKDGVFLLMTPIHPFLSAFHDPTIINIITIDTIPTYFSNKKISQATNYGISASFKVISQKGLGEKLISVLTK